MELDHALAARLAADEDIAAIVAGRVYANAAPQKATFPRVVAEVTGRETPKTHDGPGDLQRWQLVLSCQSLDKVQAAELWRAVTDSFDGMRALIGTGTVNVQGMFEQDAPDDYSPPLHADEAGVIAIPAAYLVVWNAVEA